MHNCTARNLKVAAIPNSTTKPYRHQTSAAAELPLIVQFLTVMDPGYERRRRPRCHRRGRSH